MSSIVYIIVNPTSGGYKGGSIMDLAKEKIVFGDLNITLKIYDIRDGESGRKPCFVQMKSDIRLIREINQKEQLARALNDRSLNPSPTKGESKTSPNGLDESHDDFSDDEVDPIRVIFAGGDGTVMWGMMELGVHGISSTDIVIAPLPLGTGNDFSRATGWGASVPSGFVRKNREVLRAWLVEILLGDIFNFDLWSVKIELDEELGRFNQVKGNSVVCLQQKALGNDGETLVDQNVTVLSKMCCNYFSTGVESRITFGFEKKRTSSQTMNKFFYGAESLKKMFFKKHGRINDYVKNITYENDGRMVVMDPKKSFLSNPISLIFQNIPSMASGCDFWAGSYKNADKEVTVGNEMVMTRSTDNLLNTTQEVGDGKIELLTIKSLANYSKAKAGQLRGVAKRVTQARGPFLIEFEPDYTDKIYFQIDGESYSCVHPTSFALKYSRSYRILVKRGSHLAMTSTQSKISEASFQERNGKQYTKRTLSVSKPGTPRSGSPRNDPNLDLQKTAFTPLVRAASFSATASGGVSACNRPSTTGLGLGRGLGLGDRLSIRIDKVMHLPPLVTNRRNSDTDNIPAATSP